jgi:hypothetical protein
LKSKRLRSKLRPRWQKKRKLDSLRSSRRKSKSSRRRRNRPPRHSNASTRCKRKCFEETKPWKLL